jgi:hypothetical protein
LNDYIENINNDKVKGQMEINKEIEDYEKKVKVLSRELDMVKYKLVEKEQQVMYENEKNRLERKVDKY